jgi:ABC-type glycerol-3-phosphate transport system substrate-binding protein
MINQVNWVIPGGLSGLFVDQFEYLRRDKVDARQYYKADWESWQWKGKQWAIPMQAGGEVVLYNRKLFDAKGIRRPHKDWTYDEFLDACRKLNDPTTNRFAVTIGANGLNQMMGTFVLAFGGKLLNEARDRALYGDDAKAIQGAEFDVDLHVKHRVTPSGDALLTVPAGKQPIELEMAAMEFNGIFRHTNVRAAIGAEHLDFAPPPKGPTGLQSASMWGNAWSILALSRAKEAAWQVLRWLHTREGMLAPQITAIAWPPLIWAANAPQWQDQFKGTRIAEATKVWETGGHDIIVVPEGNEAWTTMNAPVQRALRGEVGPRDAMRESATSLNELFGRRPPAWR